MALPISFKDNRRLKRLYRELEEIKSKQNDSISKARKNLKESGNSDREIHIKLANFRQDQHYECLVISDEINSHITNSLRRESKKLLLPMPFSYQEKDEEMWEITQTAGENILSEKGVSLLKKAIRKEHTEISKSKQQKRDRWIPWITAVSGLIGIIIGLLAVWSNLYK